MKKSAWLFSVLFLSANALAIDPYPVDPFDPGSSNPVTLPAPPIDKRPPLTHPAWEPELPVSPPWIPGLSPLPVAPVKPAPMPVPPPPVAPSSPSAPAPVALVPAYNADGVFLGCLDSVGHRFLTNVNCED